MDDALPRWVSSISAISLIFPSALTAEAGQLPLQVEQPSLVPGLHQLVDQGGCGGEAHGHSVLAGGEAKAQGHVGLTGAAVADGDDSVGVVRTPLLGQLQPRP